MENFSNEIWRDIPEYEGLYQVSNLGRVKSLGKGKTHNSKIHYLKPVLDNVGYYIVSLSMNGIKTKHFIHRLVTTAFIPNPDNLPCVNHKDENKLNNFVYINEDCSVDLEKSNLEWCTHDYNIKYSHNQEKCSKARIGLHHSENTKKIIKNKLTNGNLSKPVKQLDLQRCLIKIFPSAREVQRTLGYDSSYISKCCRNRLVGHNYFWEYL